MKLLRHLAMNGATFIHPYNDPDIIAGQGTIGLEILEDLQSIDTIIVPVGGGGLISGIAIAVKAKNPAVRIIGVQAAACPSAYDAIRKAEVVTVVPGQSVADGILVPQVGSLTLPVLESLVDEIILVPEEEIIDAMLILLERKKILAEGAGAAPVAALLNNHISIPKGSTCRAGHIRRKCRHTICSQRSSARDCYAKAGSCMYQSGCGISRDH